MPHHIQKPSLTLLTLRSQKTSPIQSSRNPETYSRGFRFFVRDAAISEWKCVYGFFLSSASSSQNTQLCDDVSFFHPSLRHHLNFLRPSPFASRHSGFITENSPPALPPSNCFLYMELFVLLLGVGYSFFTIPPTPVLLSFSPAPPPNAR